MVGGRIIHYQRSASGSRHSGPDHECVLQRQHHMGAVAAQRSGTSRRRGDQPHQFESSRQRRCLRPVNMPGNTAWMQFQIQAGQVTSPTPVTLTATLNSGQATLQFNVLPPSLKSISMNACNHQRWSTGRRSRDAQRSGAGRRSSCGLQQRFAFRHAASAGNDPGRQFVSIDFDSDESGCGKHTGQHQRQLERRKRSVTADDDSTGSACIHRAEPSFGHADQQVRLQR